MQLTQSHADTTGTQRRYSFRALIFRRLTIAGFVLAFIAAFVYSIITSNVIKGFYEREALQATENLAQLSELALLYESGENAREAAIATLNFPSIKHVAIVNADNKILFDEGETNDAILDSLTKDSWGDLHASIFAKTGETWQISAPVYTVYEDDSNVEFILDEEPLEKKYLGYVAIQVDVGKVKSMQYEIFIRNLIVGLAYGLTLMLVISLALNKLLKPMSKLAGVMAESTDGAYKRSDLDTSASLEIQQISDVYNQMISALAERDLHLRGQKDLLETEVALRTSELIQARDAALEANRHKSEFLANVTHELRTPLQSILGYTELLSEMLEDEGVYSCDQDIEKISRNANHLLSLINSILDISKIEAGKMDVQTQQTDVDKLIQSAADTVTPLVEKNNNQLIVNTTGLQNEIFVDEQKLFQILLNLLSNAAKFTESGVITIDALLSNMLLTIKVKDTGSGINEEQQKLIFEPFRQLDGSETRRFDGTGLGLSIVLRLTEMLGGQVRLESETGLGSCFTVELPVEVEAMRYEGEL